MSDFSHVRHLPTALRARHLGALPEPQEWFLEEKVRAGEVWGLSDVAYAVFDGDSLVEFHTERESDAVAHLLRIRQQRAFGSVLCTSFDACLIAAAKALNWRLRDTGFLFRKRNRVALCRPDGFQLVLAESQDLPEAWDIGRDFYDSPDEVAQLFRAGCLWVAQLDGQMIGNGVAIPIDDTGRVVDVGMVTRHSLRNRGLGGLIVSELAGGLERDGKRPICGCAESNLASKAALERAGFVSEHRLVRITVTS